MLMLVLKCFTILRTPLKTRHPVDIAAAAAVLPNIFQPLLFQRPIPAIDIFHII